MFVIQVPHIFLMLLNTPGKLYIYNALTHCLVFVMDLHHYCCCLALVGCVQKSKLATILTLN